LNIQKTIRDDHQAELIVELDAQQMDAAKRRAARMLSERSPIPGFRPGKAPYNVLRRYYGEEAIVEQAIDLLLEEIYPKVLEQAEIQPAAPGSLKKIESLDPPKFVFLVPLEPVVDLGDYLSVRVPYEWTPPSEDDVNRTLEELRREIGTTEKVERPVQEGDYVLVSIQARKEDDPEGAPISFLSDDNVSLLIHPDDKQTDEWPFPGFSRHLIGLSAGESTAVQHAYLDEEDEFEDLLGKTVIFEVVVKDVRVLHLADLDDDFARGLGEGYESLEQLKEAIRTYLTSASQDKYDERYYLSVLDKIREDATIKYPPQMLAQEEEHVLRDYKNAITDRGLNWKSYLDFEQKSEEEFVQEKVRPIAVKRLERRLVINEIIRRHNIHPRMEEIESEFNANIREAITFGLLEKRGKWKEVTTLAARDALYRALMRRVREKVKAISLGEWKPEDDLSPEAAEALQETPQDQAAMAEAAGDVLTAEAISGEGMPGESAARAGTESEAPAETPGASSPPIEGPAPSEGDASAEHTES